jgi:hypothetical protein
MRLDRCLGALLGQAVRIRRLALLLAGIFAFTLLGALQPAGTVMGPSSVAAHPVCGNKCFHRSVYETLGACRRAGERALRADPYPRLDWEHYHCIKGQTREGPVYQLHLWDLGSPG